MCRGWSRIRGIGEAKGVRCVARRIREWLGTSGREQAVRTKPERGLQVSTVIRIRNRVTEERSREDRQENAEERLPSAFVIVIAQAAVESRRRYAKNLGSLAAMPASLFE